MLVEFAFMWSQPAVVLAMDGDKFMTPQADAYGCMRMRMWITFFLLHYVLSHLIIAENKMQRSINLNIGMKYEDDTKTAGVGDSRFK